MVLKPTSTQLMIEIEPSSECVVQLHPSMLHRAGMLLSESPEAVLADSRINRTHNTATEILEQVRVLRQESGAFTSLALWAGIFACSA